ncbi:hypothetical protein ACHQM5_007551 [Ranunculus cassubicifolius]
MTDLSINSPRRVLSLSRNRAKAFSYPDEKVSGFAVSEEHGPKPSEVYGFVGSISTVVATGYPLHMFDISLHHLRLIAVKGNCFVCINEFLFSFDALITMCLRVSSYFFDVGVHSGILVTFNGNYLLPKQVSQLISFLILTHQDFCLSRIELGVFRYWALAVPTYAMVSVFLAIVFYIGQNFMATPSPTSLNTMFDEFNREHSTVAASLEEEDQPIEPISDIGIDRINHAMFNTLN